MEPLPLRREGGIAVGVELDEHVAEDLRLEVLAPPQLSLSESEDRPPGSTSLLEAEE